MKKFGIMALATVVALGMGISAKAATISLDVQDLGTPPTTFGTLTYEGDLGEILGFYDGGTSDSLAERFGATAPFTNSDEEALVASLTGLSVVNLSGDIPLSSTSATIDANNYFTAKFAQSIAVFHNTSDRSIVVSFSNTTDCQETSLFTNNECGGISHYKQVSDGTPPGNVPLPAGAWFVLPGIAAFAMLRRRRKLA